MPLGLPFIRTFLWVGWLALGAILGGLSVRWWHLGKGAFEPRTIIESQFSSDSERLEKTDPPSFPQQGLFDSRAINELPGNEAEALNTTDRSTPIPPAWESTLKAALWAQDSALRNSALIYLATVTAANVPRIQAECLAHLTYGLEESDIRQFLALANNPVLPLEARIAFVEKTLEIRTLEFSMWFAQEIINSGDATLSKICQDYLVQNRKTAIPDEGFGSGPF